MIEFDGPNKLIVLDGAAELSVADLYSRWKDWWSSDDNSKYLASFRTVGGDSIDASAGTSIPLFAFLINGWRIRPSENNQTLVVNGGVLLSDDGDDPFVDTLGQYNVRINYQNPVQAIGVSSGGAVVDQNDVTQMLRTNRQILALVAAMDPSIIIASGGAVSDAAILRILRTILALTASQ